MNKIIAFFLLLALAACSSEQTEPAKKAATAEPPMAKQLPMSQTPSKPAFTSISPLTAQKLIADKTDLLILDTRTTREIVTNGTIAGAQQTSLRTIFQNELTIPKETPILVICAVGGRSYAAGKIMVKHGFKEIYNLSGGLDKWKAAKLPVVYPK